MSKESKRFWDMISAMQVSMVTTEDEGVMRSRPMAPFVDINTHSIRFVTDGHSAKVFEIKADRDIAVSFADTQKMIFASVSGRATISRERDLIRELWGPYCDVFFEGGPDDADVAVIEVHPVQAEFWDNDKGKVSAAVEMTRAYFDSAGPDLGENAKLDL